MEQQGVFLTQEPPPSQGAGQEGRARRKVLAQKEREAFVKKKMTAPFEAMKACLHAAVNPRPPARPGSTERKEAARKALMSLKDVTGVSSKSGGEDGHLLAPQQEVQEEHWLVKPL